MAQHQQLRRLRRVAAGHRTSQLDTRTMTTYIRLNAMVGIMRDRVGP
jgi:hypothetical protein